jgi:hypothetical protein
MKRLLLCVGFVTGCLLLAGCGGVTRDAAPKPRGQRYHYRLPEGQRVSVQVGKVVDHADLDADVRRAVDRYIRDQAEALLGEHDLYEVVSEEQATDLMAQYMGADSKVGNRQKVDAVMDVYILELKEKMGATVKVGFVSKQSKAAVAKLRVTMRFPGENRTFERDETAKSSKGAWGAVASVDRRKMRKKEGYWALDGSMAGTACTEALSDALRDISKRVTKDRGLLKALANQ